MARIKLPENRKGHRHITMVMAKGLLGVGPDTTAGPGEKSR